MKSPKNAERVRIKQALEKEILDYRRDNAVQWMDFKLQYKLEDSDRWPFYRVGQPDSTFKSVKRFHDLIFKNKSVAHVEVSDDNVGIYVRSDYQSLEGGYALIRPSVHETGVIYGYMAAIEWDRTRRIHFMTIDSPGSVFQAGKVYFRRDLRSVCIHFSEQNNHSMLLLKPSLSDMNLYGSLLSVLPTESEEHFAPACVPAVLVRKEREIALDGGYISPGHKLYETCLDLIASVPSRGVVSSGWWSNSGSIAFKEG